MTLSCFVVHRLQNPAQKPNFQSNHLLGIYRVATSPHFLRLAQTHWTMPKTDRSRKSRVSTILWQDITRSTSSDIESYPLCRVHATLTYSQLHRALLALISYSSATVVWRNGESFRISSILTCSQSTNSIWKNIDPNQNPSRAKVTQRTVQATFKYIYLIMAVQSEEGNLFTPCWSFFFVNVRVAVVSSNNVRCLRDGKTSWPWHL